VVADRLNPNYFNNPPEMPESILTLENSTEPFVSIALQSTTRDGSGIYKVSGNQPLEEEWIGKIFLGVKYSYVHHWVYTFPVLEPLGSGQAYQPIVLADNLLYISGVESVSTAMECSVLSGRNVAQIISKLMRNSNCESSTVS